MKQYNRKSAQKGFTLIELVVVIAILAILAAFALPRFAQLSEQAHQSSIRATAGALSAGVALVKVQWVSNGNTGEVDNVQGFGNNDVDVTALGWPASVSGANDAIMTNDRCSEVWGGLLQSNAPTVGVAQEEYVISLQADTNGGNDCVFTYRADGQGSTIRYDADTGEIDTIIN